MSASDAAFGDHGQTDALARWGAWAPALIAVYILALFALRVSLSPYLEVDEAQFVGHVDLRLVYENSHPPLYNWVLRAVLEATGWNWAVSTGAVKYALLGFFHLLTWDAARRLGGPRAGLLAVSAAAFLPQVVWMSVHTLAHSTMVLAGAAATVHAAVLLIQRATTARYVWFGAALALGALAKYNFVLFAAPLLLALFLSRQFRPIFFSRPARISAAVFAVMLLPTLVAAALDMAASSGRIEKLYRADADLVWYDVPGLGLDGLLSLALACLAWLGPAALIFGAANWLDRRRGAPAPTSALLSDGAAFRRALGWTLALGLGAFALIVLAADMHRVHERYLTPIFAAAPVWLALAWPPGDSARKVAALAAGAFLAALIGFWGMASFGTHRYGYDYDAVAAAVSAAVPEPAPLFSPRHDDAANVTLALGWPGAAGPSFQPLEDRAVLLWRGKGDAPEALIPDGFAPGGEVGRLTMPFANMSGKTMDYGFQLLERGGQP